MPLSVSSLIACAFFDKCSSPLRNTFGALLNWILSYATISMRLPHGSFRLSVSALVAVVWQKIDPFQEFEGRGWAVLAGNRPTEIQAIKSSFALVMK
jgi:hypothetical protein